MARSRMTRWAPLLLWAGLIALAATLPAAGAGPTAGDPFAAFDLPDDWQARFWADPDVQALLALEPGALADLVPVQAGIRHCRCPACDAREADDPLRWSPAKPEKLTCRQCGVELPDDQYPAKVDKKVPEDVIEVLPRVFHHYPYHAVESEKQLYPDERLYLAAKRDYEAREFLSRAALYAALRSRKLPDESKERKLGRFACVLLLRFAQVYPAYATHYDQPGEPKYFDRADLGPPYRAGYRTGKWDWSACLDVPLNLVLAYAIARHDPALIEAGELLGDPRPARTIERQLFLASAEFVRRQPESVAEMALLADRGILAVGRLLDDPDLMHDSMARLRRFAERGFYHDGLWRQGDAAGHRRVMALIDGWIDRLLAGYSDPPGYRPPDGAPRFERLPGAAVVPVLALARDAAGTVLSDPKAAEIQQVAWPAPTPLATPRRAALLGGAGLARLAVGQGGDALDLELRGLGDFGAARSQRLTLRLAVAGRPVLGDLDDLPPLADGFDRATASHNAVIIDGLNQREDPEQARLVAAGGDVLFFAADPDFQVASVDDRHAYPRSATVYRQTVLAVAGPRARYAVGLFEVHGGLQHDQILHAAAGSASRWQLATPLTRGPRSLLPASIPYLPTARAEDGRWFVQALGAFGQLANGPIVGATQALLSDGRAPGVRVHLLGDFPMTAIVGTTPDPTAPTPDDPRVESGRSALVLRRRSGDGSTLHTAYLTVFEPIGGTAPPLKRVGRLAAEDGVIALIIETADGVDHLIINPTPGTARAVALPGGKVLRTDGLAVRSSGRALILAGGSFADLDGHRVAQSRAEGQVTRAGREVGAGSRGWFETGAPLPEPGTLAGRTLSIRHADGTTRNWTIRRAINLPDGTARIEVREEPGFRIDPARGDAVYYQFPRDRAPGPHAFRVAKIAR